MKNLIKILIAFSIVIVTGMNVNAQVSVGISIRVAPPALPVYSQPYCPGDGYMWAPGYWAYGDDGYYWVPGTWVLPPQTGFLWTPGYWGFNSGFYGWHQGYWGRHIGFYGGINYGFGYGGVGYGGGMWRGNTFRYNTAVNNINTTVVHNTYINRTVINNTTIVNNHTSFNGQGGIMAKPSQRELQASREPHLNPTSVQMARETSFRADRSQYASVNHGRPAMATMDEANKNQRSQATANKDQMRNQRMNVQKQKSNHHEGNGGRNGKRKKNH